MQLSNIRYEEPAYCDPLFPVIFHTDMINPARRFIYTNWHSGIELLYCVEGSAHLLSDMRGARFGKGELVVIGSNALHTIYADSCDCYYYCLTVEPCFLQENGIPAEALCLRSVICDPNVSAIFEEIMREFTDMRPLYKSAVLGCLLRLFTLLGREYRLLAEGAQAAAAPRQHAAIQNAIQYMHTHIAEAVSLDDICRHAGISKYYFCRLFRAFTDMTPLQFINMLRCDYARRLMKEGGVTVSEAARAVGVDNLSYFTRIYKRYIGTLPSRDAVRKEKRERRGAAIGIPGT